MHDVNVILSFGYLWDRVQLLLAFGLLFSFLL